MNKTEALEEVLEETLLEGVRHPWIEYAVLEEALDSRPR
ncbi:hypothetical protein FHS44_008103 [Streptosporangium saharense]|uniref:Uncharacterized protein n=1 Tax=Streptosporangium saharense TaxID=1706840 RepID=A0A7W7QW82_9ACTN|nr:hypothetical protein [Streptosporangium saharense]